MSALHAQIRDGTRPLVDAIEKIAKVEDRKAAALERIAAALENPPAPAPRRWTIEAEPDRGEVQSDE